METTEAVPLREFLVNITIKYKTRHSAAAFLVCVFEGGRYERQEKRCLLG